MKTSLVITVLNEEKSISTLLKAIASQTKKPYEVIIVDGGSSDSTLERIKNYELRIKNKVVKVKTVIRPGSTIAQGRNIGIAGARGDIIAMTDGGCVPHRDWFEKITRPFVKQKTDIVAGFYQMRGSTHIQRALAVFLGVSPQRFDFNTFLPSARSMAFRRSLWEKVGGFSEKLGRAGEDTLFNYEAIKFGAKFERVKDAVVDWEVPDSLWNGVKKFYIYSRGDVEAGIWWHPKQRISTHNLRIVSIFSRYLIGFCLFLLGFKIRWFWYTAFFLGIVYIFWSVWKMREIVHDWKVRLWLPVIQIMSDLAVIFGAIAALFERSVGNGRKMSFLI